jgi:hypothetical protein
VEVLEDRRVLTTLFALFSSGQIVSFDSSAPGTYTGSSLLSGLHLNEIILKMDFRPATGQLYGLSNFGQLYTIDPLSGATKAVGTPYTPLNGPTFGFSFDPVRDQIRVVSDQGQNLRIDPNTGTVTADPMLFFAPSDPNSSQNGNVYPQIVAAAYTNQIAGATKTTLYDFDSFGPDLVRQGSPGGSPISPDSGELFTIGPTTVFSLPNDVGFDIAADSGTAFFSGSQFGPRSFDSELYSVDLATGATRNLGQIANTGSAVVDITVSPGDNAQSLLNQRFVAQVYRDLFHREADPSGLATWTSALDHGVTRIQVVFGMEGSPEYRGDVVQQFYSQLLHRAPDPAGLQNGIAFLQAGGTDEKLGAALAGSPEYFQVRGGGTNEGFLSALYQDVLARPPDSGGQTFYEGELATGVSRTQVAAAIFGSDEYRRDLVEGYYSRFLRRPADADGLQAYVSYLAAGGTDEGVIAAIVGSAEYLTHV